jgi:DNA helicase HerA-like ATPase
MHNALDTIETEIFNQPAKKKLSIESLIRPGKVTISDISSLNEFHGRAVALYLLTVLRKYKLKPETEKTGLLLVIDEASRFFPSKNQYEIRKEYLKRIENFIKKIVHFGRKHQYGVAFATQHPGDVSEQIIDLCNTKVVFRMVGQKSWINTYLNEGYAERVRELKDGEALIICRDVHDEPVKIYTPFVSDYHEK